PNQGVSLGVGQPVDQWLLREADRVLAEYGHHPSFMFLAAGNEPGGPNSGSDFLSPWIKKHAQHESGVLVTGGSGWPMIEANEFHVTSRPRIHQWGDELRSRINAKPPETATDYQTLVERFVPPIVSHETGQWCVFPNIRETEKYTGAMRATSLEIIRDFLDKSGMIEQADDFVMASGKLQTICYKEDIESCLRTPQLGGFQLLDLHDFPGQGTAPVGILDSFWDAKTYVNADQFRRFCDAVVPLARWSKRIWKNDETISVPIDVAHYGRDSIVDAVVRWQIVHDGHSIQSGQFDVGTIAFGGLRSVATVQCDLSALPVASDACELTLEIQVGGQGIDDGVAVNDWNFWVYSDPELTSDLTIEKSPSSKVWFTDQWNREVLDRLATGQRVVYTPPPKTVDTNVTLGFSPIFWNLVWTNRQPPHTLGILCDSRHPALAGFPTSGHSDWQWWSILTRAAAMNLDHLPSELQPIVQVVPDWYDPQRLGLLFEAKCGGGKLLVCSMDLTTESATDPVRRQMLRSITRYVNGDSFDPKIEVTPKQIQAIEKTDSVLGSMNAVVTCDSQQAGYPASHAIDGDMTTLWHSAWGPSLAPFPHWLQVDMKRARAIAGIRCWPRSDRGQDRIRNYQVQVSSDAIVWSTVAEGQWWRDDSRHDVWFEKDVSVRYVRLTALSGHAGKLVSSLAELDVILTNE
ncbi:MAG: discoidin domain-containing protein, partial [Rubripirellula sp.]